MRPPPAGHQLMRPRPLAGIYEAQGMTAATRVDGLCGALGVLFYAAVTAILYIPPRREQLRQIARLTQDHTARCPSEAGSGAGASGAGASGAECDPLGLVAFGLAKERVREQAKATVVPRDTRISNHGRTRLVSWKQRKSAEAGRRPLSAVRAGDQLILEPKGGGRSAAPGSARV